MPGGFVNGFTQEFAASSSVSVIHNLGREDLFIRVIVGGVVRNDLVVRIVPTAEDPTNKLTVTLVSSQTGIVQILLADALPVALPTLIERSSRWQEWEFNAIQSTALETWQTALTKTTAKLAPGKHRIMWNFELRVVASGSLDSLAVARFNYDGGLPEGIFNHKRAGWCGYSGWDFVVATAGQQPILKIDFRRDPIVGGDDTVEIRRVKMSIERMGQ